MAWIVADRVKDSSTTTGVGSFTVSGTAPSSFQTFSAVLSVSDTFPYFIEHQTANEWEVGLGTYSGVNTIARTAVLASSNSNLAVNFSAGTKNVEIAPNARHFTGISSQPDGTASSGSNIGRIVFSTQTSGSASFTERLRIDSNGRIIATGAAGGAAANSFQEETTAVAINPYLQVLSTTSDTDIGIGRFSDTTTCGRLMFGKSRGASIGTYTAPSSGDHLGAVFFEGSDGLSGIFQPSAVIFGIADAGHTSGSTPGRISFWTSASGSVPPVERMRIDALGQVIMAQGGSASVAGVFGAGALQIHRTDSKPVTIMQWTSTDSPTIDFGRSRSGTIGTHNAVSANDNLGTLRFSGSGSASGFVAGVQIAAWAASAFSSNSAPSYLTFHTSTSGGGSGLTERMRIDQTGGVYLETLGTTAATTPTVIISTGSTPGGLLLRSTSSVRYKENVSPIEPLRLDAAGRIRPVEYTSIASADVGNTKRYVGYLAEEVAEIDDTLVSLDPEGRPDAVAYDKVLLLKVARLEREVADLRARLH